MDITKIKYKDGEVRIEWVELRTDETSITHVMTSKEEPRKQFFEALANLRITICTVCEFPMMFHENITVIGLTITWMDSGIWGAVITGLRKLSGSTSPMVINTPFKPSEPMSEHDNNFLDPVEVSRLSVLMNEAAEYVNGERAVMQTDVFAETVS